MLYTICYETKFKPSDAHVYDQLGWDDADVEALCKVLESEPLPACKQLWCSHNNITDVGMGRLTEMLHKGAVESLETLDLKGNPEASEKSKDALRDARADLEVFFSQKITSVNDLS